MVPRNHPLGLARIPGAPDDAILTCFLSAITERVRALLLARAGVEGAADRLQAACLHLADLRASFRFPIDQLALALRLDAIEEETLHVATAVHLAPDLRELVRLVRQDPGHDRVDGALLLQLLFDRRDEALGHVGRFRPGDRLAEAGLVEYAAPALAHTPSLLEWEIVPTPRLLGILRGVLALDHRLADVAAVHPAATDGAVGIVEAEAWTSLVAIARAAHARGPVQVLLSGPDGVGKARAAAALASALGLGFAVTANVGLLPGGPPELSVVLKLLARECGVCGAVLVLTHVPPDWRGLPILEAIQRQTPCVAVLTSETAWSAPALVARCAIGRPHRAMREAAWAAELRRAGLAEARWPVLGRMADAYPLARPAIARAIALAFDLALARGVDGGDEDHDYDRAAAAQVDSALARYAQRSRSRARLADLVLCEEIRDSVHEIAQAARHRARAPHALAIGHGLCALFNGPPGTGKTLAANAIANELGLPLYRIDVSRIVDRYVGETEKNLARLFEEAASDHAALLFDEADSLLARRTQVSDASDRHANTQVNMLLNLIEDYEGLVFLTTNLKGSLDPALLRRITFKLDFKAPETAERAALWRHHVAHLESCGPVDVERLARDFRVSGGEIKNAAYRAALVAGEGTVTETMLRRAVESELWASGGVPNHRERRVA